MIELRKRVLETGFVMLEYKTLICQVNDKGDPDVTLAPVWSEWGPVPYVDKDGNPLGINIKTGYIGA